jgi:signal transduction histidine kinase
MEQISFNMAARAAGLMGRESVPSQYGALIELVKNAYDADATKCVVFVDYNNDKIWIADDGEGMTPDIIKECWMVIGTDSKLSKPLSTKNRVRAGAKGIGRFSLDRLGAQCEMYTKTSSGNLLCWQVDWSNFDKPGVVLTDVKANLFEYDDLDRLAKQMNLSPFFEEEIRSSLENNGTLFCITDLRDSWNDDSKKTLKQLETLKYPHGKKIFDTYLIDSATYKKDAPFKSYKIEVPEFDDFDYHLKCDYKSGTFAITITRNEIDKDRITRSFYNKLEENEYPYNTEGFQRDAYTINRTLEQLIPNINRKEHEYIVSNLGEMFVDLYFVKKAPGSNAEKFRYRYFNSNDRREWLETYGGIKIFRDNFKVRPYGEGEARDWLNLSSRKAQNPAAVTRKGGGRITEDQIAGAVHISRIDSTKLDDVASREGIKDDQLFDGLKKIITELIALIESDRHYAAVALEDDYWKTDGKKELVAAKAVESVYKKIPSKDVKTLKRAFRVHERKIASLAGELSLLRGLAGIGAVTASFAHDLRGLQNKIANYTDLTGVNVKKACVEDTPEKIKALRYLEKVDTQHDKINHWLFFITGAIKRDKRKRNHINISSYLQNLRQNWEDLLKDKKVSLQICDIDDSLPKIRAFEIDLDSLFSNLILNSIDAFKKQAGDRNINISIVEQNNDIMITYTDSGPGLHGNIKDKNSILNFGFSTKKDEHGEEGMGLGMYIVDCIVKDNSGHVNINRPVSGFEIELYWPKVNRG